MLIYCKNKKQFIQDVHKQSLEQELKNLFLQQGIYNNSERESIAWKNSLPFMCKVLDDPSIPEDIQIAIEYQIPLTAKRIDFIIAGLDNQNKENLVLIELKQWEEAMQTSRNGIVTTYVGNMIRSVPHPSYQVYSYAKMLENYNSLIQNKNIQLHPCTFLHNYKKSKLKEIVNSHYEDILNYAPVFIKNEEVQLRNFIKQFISKAPNEDLMYKIDCASYQSSNALQDCLSNMLKGNEEFIMIDEQKVIFETIKKLVERSNQNHEKYTVIIEGGPGTGKSVIAIQLLTELITKYNMKVNYVTKNATPRNVYFEKLKKDNYKATYVKNLFKSSGSYVNIPINFFNCLIVDEAHRLNEKSGFKIKIGENQIKEIINASKVSVFFIDERQIVTTSDIGSIEEIKKWAAICNSKVIHNESIKLSSQFRCHGSNGYIAFIYDLLEICKTANTNGFDLDFDLKIYDDPKQMRENLRTINLKNNKARMIAGYCYEWRSKNSNDLSVYDIELPGGFFARWNFNTTNTWAIDEDSFDQVGCIHTSQGIEFEYTGIIIGNDMRYENGRVITDPTKRSKDDYSLRGLKKNPNPHLADTIIRNTYATLLTRAQKGCYIYCEDKNLNDYFKYRISKLKANSHDHP